MGWLKNPSFIRKWLGKEELQALRELLFSLEQQIETLKTENKKLENELHSSELHFSLDDE
jgi:cell division protein FtsB